MISLDRGFFGGGSSGDVIERHQKYAELAGVLDVIVFSSKEYEQKVIGNNLRVFPTRSSKSSHFQKAVEIALKLHKEHPYDLLVTQEFAAPAGQNIKLAINLPWIVSVHSMFFSSAWLKFNLGQWYMLYRIKKAIRYADGFRVNNEIIEKKLLAWGIKKPIVVQPTPIDVTRFITEDKPINAVPNILFAGRLEAEKNIPMLISAVKNLPHDFSLTIVGDGSLRKDLEDLAKGDTRIIFLGRKTLEELPPVFKAADIFVLPSNTESFGQVLLQASAAGAAIIATKTAGAMSIIEHEKNGILINIGDESALKQSLLRLISDQELRSNLVKEAKIALKRFDSDIGTEKTMALWKEISGK